MGMNMNFVNARNNINNNVRPSNYNYNSAYSRFLQKLQADISYTNGQFASLKKANSKQVFLTALRSSDNRIKAAACLMAFDYDFEYIEDLVDAVGSSDMILNQSARLTLVKLSNKILCDDLQKKIDESKKNDLNKKNGKSTPPTVVNRSQHYVDFGPNVYYMDNQTLNTTQNMWKIWFDEKTRNIKKSGS